MSSQIKRNRYKKDNIQKLVDVNKNMTTKERLTLQANEARAYNQEKRRLAEQQRLQKDKEYNDNQYYLAHKDQMDEENDTAILQKLNINNLKSSDIKLIDKIKNDKLRSRLQHEYNLQISGFYKNVQTEIKDNKERKGVNDAFNSLMTAGISSIPKVGEYVADGYKAMNPQISKANSTAFQNQYAKLLEQYPELADGPYQSDVDLSGGHLRIKLKNGYHCKICGKTVKSWSSHTKSKAHQLKGAGFFDFLRKGKDWLVDKFRKKLDGFNSTSTTTLKKYGDLPIMSLRVFKKPIHKVLDKVIDFISMGKFSEAKKKYGFDQMYHLGCLASVNDNGKHKIVQFEKVEAVKFFDGQKVSGSDVEFLDVPISGSVTLNEMAAKAREKVGDKTYFDYNSFTNNCQFFIRYNLEYGLGVWTSQINDFVMQDVSKLGEEMPSVTKTIMNGITDLGQIADNVMGGDLKPITNFEKLKRDDLTAMIHAHSGQAIKGLNKMPKSKLIELAKQHYKVKNNQFESDKLNVKVEHDNNFLTHSIKVHNSIPKDEHDNNFVIHSIKVHNSIPIDEQIKHVQNISKSKKKRMSKLYGEYTNYRIIPKTKFEKKSYRTKNALNGKIKIVFGKLKQ